MAASAAGCDTAGITGIGFGKDYCRRCLPLFEDLDSFGDTVLLPVNLRDNVDVARRTDLHHFFEIDYGRAFEIVVARQVNHDRPFCLASHLAPFPLRFPESVFCGHRKVFRHKPSKNRGTYRRLSRRIAHELSREGLLIEKMECLWKTSMGLRPEKAACKNGHKRGHKT